MTPLLQRATFAALCLTLLVLPWTTAGFSIGLGLATLCSLLAWRRGTLNLEHPFLLPSLVWVGALLISFIWSHADRAGDEARTYYPFLLTFVAGAAVKSGEQARQMGLVLLGTATVSAAIACCHQLGWIDAGTTRYSGTVTIFTFAMVMATAYIIAALTFAAAERRWVKALAFVVGMLTLGGIVANGSRAILIAVAAAYLAILALLHRRRVPLLLFLLPAVAAAPLVLQTKMGKRLLYVQTELHLDGSPPSNREAMWVAANKMFYDHPYMGVGVGSFVEEYERIYAQGQMEGYPDLSEHHKTAHNIPLHIAATMGTVGLVAFAIWFGGYIVYFLRHRARDRLLAAGALALLALVLGFGVTDMSLLNSRITGLLAIGLGACLGGIRAQEQEARSVEADAVEAA
ncbi:MAG: O-antigen ligase family protein [Planctomycetota bacterium]|jgi:O-antigen ligase